MTPPEALLGSVVEKMDALSVEVRDLRTQYALLRARVDAFADLADRLSRLEERLDKIEVCRPERKDPRFSFNEAVKVALVTERDRLADGRVVNVSNQGLGLVLDTELPVGAEVEVDLNAVLVRGKIVHCRPDADGFAVGVSLDQPLASTWS